MNYSAELSFSRCVRTVLMVGVMLIGQAAIADERIEFHPSHDESVCLDVYGASQAEGAGVGIYGCNGTASQRWTFYGGLIRTSLNGKCLTAFPGVRQVTVRTCTGNDDQRWRRQADRQYVSEAYGTSLSTGGQRYWGAPVITYAAFGAADQRWFQYAQARAVHTMVGDGGNCLVVSHQDRMVVGTEACSDSDNQRWDVGDGRMRSKVTNECVNVNEVVPGSFYVFMQPCNDSSKQAFVCLNLGGSFCILGRPAGGSNQTVAPTTSFALVQSTPPTPGNYGVLTMSNVSLAKPQISGIWGVGQ